MNAMIDLTISQPFKQAVGFALGYQIPLLILASMATDGGGLYQICSLTFVAFWGCIGVMWLCRRRNPTELDLGIVKAGFVPLCYVTALICDYIWGVRGF